MSNLNLYPLPETLHISSIAVGSSVLLACVQGRFTGRRGTEVASRQSRAEITDILRTQQGEARVGAGPRVACCGVRPRRLHLPGMRAAWRTLERRSRKAVFSVSRSPLRIGERPHALRILSPQDAHVRLARVLAQAPFVAEIAAKRLAQETLFGIGG